MQANKEKLVKHDRPNEIHAIAIAEFMDEPETIPHDGCPNETELVDCDSYRCEGLPKELVIIPNECYRYQLKRVLAWHLGRIIKRHPRNYRNHTHYNALANVIEYLNAESHFVEYAERMLPALNIEFKETGKVQSQ